MQSAKGADWPLFSSSAATPAVEPASEAAKLDRVELTILMPCLNEARTVGQCVAAARGFLQRAGIAGEVLVADNGSSDGSREIAQAAGALDPSFVDSNGYGQSHVLIVHEVSGTQLQVLVMTCGGTAIPDQSARHLIELAGGPIKGGGIPAVGVLSTNRAIAIGANGGLKVVLANFSGTACPPAPGHIVSSFSSV